MTTSISDGFTPRSRDVSAGELTEVELILSAAVAPYLHKDHPRACRGYPFHRQTDEAQLMLLDKLREMLQHISLIRQYGLRE